MGAYLSGELIQGGVIKLFDKCCIKSSLPKILFSILLQEQSQFKHKSLSQSSSSPRVGAYSRGAYSMGAY